MRVMKFLAILMALVCVPLLSHAAEVKGNQLDPVSSGTRIFWLSIRIRANRMLRDLRVNVTKLDKEGNLNIYAYGRATKQVVRPARIFRGGCTTSTLITGTPSRSTSICERDGRT